MSSSSPAADANKRIPPATDKSSVYLTSMESTSVSCPPPQLPLLTEPTVIQRSCLSRSSSSGSSMASYRSVRFKDGPDIVMFTYPKGVYDRAPIAVDRALALKRCGREEECKKWSDSILLLPTIESPTSIDAVLCSSSSSSSSDDESDDEDHHHLYSKAGWPSRWEADEKRQSLLQGDGHDTDDQTSDEDAAAMTTPASSPFNQLQEHVVAQEDGHTLTLASSFPPYGVPSCDHLEKYKECTVAAPTFARWTSLPSLPSKNGQDLNTSGVADSQKVLLTHPSRQDERKQKRLRLLQKLTAYDSSSSSSGSTDEGVYSCLNGF